MSPFLLALITTILVESTIFWLILRQEILKTLLYSILINSTTQPLANAAYLTILPHFFLVELIVILVESILIMKLFEVDYHKALLISVTANVVTASLSFLF